VIGAHTASADPLAAAVARDADLVQFFLSNPRAWKPPVPRRDAERLRASPIPLYVHAPYLVNVVAGSSRVHGPSRRLLQETCDAAADLGAAAVVVHAGQVTGDGDPGSGPARWRRTLLGLDPVVPVLIENTASGDAAVARTVEGIGRLWEEVGDLGVGFVLDTCHAWAAGEPLAELVERVLAVTGRIDLVHCNDSRDPFGSRRDRHANLGEGTIPVGELVAVVRAADAPVVVETPLDGQAADISRLRRLLG